MRFWPAAVRESPIPPGGKNPSPGRSDAFPRQSLPMVASPGPEVVRGGVWLQYRALAVVIYVFTASVRRFGVLRTGCVRRAGVPHGPSIAFSRPFYVVQQSVVIEWTHVGKPS